MAYYSSETTLLNTKEIRSYSICLHFVVEQQLLPKDNHDGIEKSAKVEVFCACHDLLRGSQLYLTYGLTVLGMQHKTVHETHATLKICGENSVSFSFQKPSKIYRFSKDFAFLQTYKEHINGHQRTASLHRSNVKANSFMLPQVRLKAFFLEC